MGGTVLTNLETVLGTAQQQRYSLIETMFLHVVLGVDVRSPLSQRGPFSPPPMARHDNGGTPSPPVARFDSGGTPHQMAFPHPGYGADVRSPLPQRGPYSPPPVARLDSGGTPSQPVARLDSGGTPPAYSHMNFTWRLISRKPSGSVSPGFRAKSGAVEYSRGSPVSSAVLWAKSRPPSSVSNVVSTPR